MMNTMMYARGHHVDGCFCMPDSCPFNWAEIIPAPNYSPMNQARQCKFNLPKAWEID